MNQTSSPSLMHAFDIPQTMRGLIAALPAIYHDAVQYELLAQMTAPQDIPFYRALVAESGGAVLELGCGTGRVLIELAKSGVEAVGVDLSPALLELARHKAENEGVGVTLALGDIRSFDLGRSFPHIFVTYNTFNHLLDLDSVRDCLQSLMRHMDADSRMVIDTFQPSLAFLGDQPEQRRAILRYLDPHTGQEVVLYEENHYEPATQINRVVWSYQIGGKADARVEELRMRLFFPQELDALLTLSGFEIEAKYGDYDRCPFASDTPKQLTVCRVAT